MKLTLPAKYITAVSLFASKDETRYILNGFKVEAKKGRVVLVATDGRCLFTVNVTDDSEISGDAAEFVFPASLAVGLPRATQEGKGRLTIEYDGKEISVSGSRKISAPCLEGNFPNWRQVIPSAPPKPMDSIHVDVGFLNKFERAIHLIAKNNYGMRLSAGGQTDPIVIRPLDASVAAIGVVMPIRSEGSFELPEWLSAN